VGALRLRLAGEGEVAFVMAHEVGHHLGRHLHEQAAAAGGGAAAAGVLLAVLAGVAGGDEEDALGAFELGALVGGVGAAVRYSLAAETEADYLAAYLVARAGYDPAAGREVMLKLAALRGGAGALERSFLGTHPSHPERVAANEQAAAEIAAKAAAGQPLLPSPRPGSAAGAAGAGTAGPRR